MKLVIFDCDGTIVDSQHIILTAMHAAYGAHGMAPPARERLLSIVGLSLPDAFRKLGEGEAAYPVDTLVEQYRNAFFGLRASEDHLEPTFPGAIEAIDALARRDDVVLGIATGKTRRGLEAVLSRHALLNRFVTINTADTAPSKPHPGMVLNAMRDVGAAPEDTIMIGDTTYDVEMARSAGAAAIGVAWGYHPVGALHAAGASAVIASYEELVPAIDRLWG